MRGDAQVVVTTSLPGCVSKPRAYAGFRIARCRSGHADSLAPTLVQVEMTYGDDSREATALNVDKFFGDVASQQARLRISAAVKFQRRTRASPGLASDRRDKGHKAFFPSVYDS